MFCEAWIKSEEDVAKSIEVEVEQELRCNELKETVKTANDLDGLNANAKKCEEDPLALSDDDNGKPPSYKKQIGRTFKKRRLESTQDRSNKEDSDDSGNKSPTKRLKANSENGEPPSAFTPKSFATSSSNENTKFNKSALFDGIFFSIVEEVGENIKAKCQLCTPKKKYIKGKVSSTTNFLSHLRKIHKSSIAEYQMYKEIKRKDHSVKEIKSVKEKGEVIKEQSDIRISKTSDHLQQEEFDKRIVKFMVNSMSAVSVVENPAFIDIFDGLGVKVMSQATAMNKISAQCENSLKSIKSELESVEFICTTADVWSSKRRNFLGVTCHWIRENFEGKSVALACRRFNCNLAFDKIAEILDDVNVKFKLNQKVVGTVTDNGTNFAKAFRGYGVKLSERVLMADLNDKAHEDQDEDEYVDADEQDHDICSILSLSTNDEVSSPSENIHFLPNHTSCISHTINLIATIDIMKEINGSSLLQSKHAIIMNKCSQLWNKAGSPKSAEIIKQFLGYHLSYPGVIRLNSYYKSLGQILNEKEKVSELFEKLGIKNLAIKNNEFDYLEEYVQILKPLAMAVEILQSENNTYFGVVVPTIASLKIKFEKMEIRNFKYLGSVIETCIGSIKSCFSNYLTWPFKSEHAVVASTTHPKFKLRWLTLIKDEAVENNIKKIIIEKVNIIEGKRKAKTNKDVEAETLATQLEKEFFEFESSNVKSDIQNVSGQGEIQFLQYLQDPETDITMLNKYPLIKKLFLKYNVILPSSAPVEKLFPYETFINAPARHVLSDKNFENLMLLKCNEF